MINAYLAASLVSGVLAFGSAWQIQTWRADAHENDQRTLQADDAREAAARERSRITGVVVAQNLARKRELGLLADADGARVAVDGLRTATSAALSAAHASHDACLVAAATNGELLNASAAAYRELAEISDRHVSDIQTLTDAWPK